MALSMTASRVQVANAPFSAASSAQRRPAARTALVVCRASQDSRQSFAQVAARGLMALTLAAGMSMAPAPAQAKDVLFYGRPGPIAEKKAEFDALLDAAVATMEAQQAKAPAVVAQVVAAPAKAAAAVVSAAPAVKEAASAAGQSLSDLVSAASQ